MCSLRTAAPASTTTTRSHELPAFSTRLGRWSSAMRPRFALTAVLMAMCCAAATVASADGADGSGIPAAVAQCLGRADADRAACFAELAGDVPAFVSSCLAGADTERAACFAGPADVPDLVGRCLPLPDPERAACFAGQADVPDFVAKCLP